MKYGSFNNLYASRGISSMTPYVGMGATELLWSDRHAYTVVEVSPSGKTLKLQRDIAIRVDGLGMSDGQSYRYEPDPAASLVTVRKCRDGRWKSGGSVFAVGYRSEHYDYSF